jgi:acyl-CoA thioester hydrolase
LTRETPRGREAYRIWREIGTRWTDNDAYGHVNNIVYYGWFDTAVNAWLIERGLLDVAGGDVIGLVVKSGCSYFAPLSFPEPVSVGLSIAHVGTSSVTYALGVFARDAVAAAAEGSFVHAYVDRASGRPVPLSDAWRTALAEIAV